MVSLGFGGLFEFVGGVEGVRKGVGLPSLPPRLEMACWPSPSSAYKNCIHPSIHSFMEPIPLCDPPSPFETCLHHRHQGHVDPREEDDVAEQRGKRPPHAARGEGPAPLVVLDVGGLCVGGLFGGST